MGSVRRRNGKWHAQVRRKGWQSFTKTFQTKKDATSWCIEIEKQLTLSSQTTTPSSKTLSEVCDLYGQIKSIQKNGYREERYRLQQIAASPVGRMDIRYITDKQVEDYFKNLEENFNTGTVRKMYFLFKSVLQFSNADLGIATPFNPLSNINVPKDSTPRTKRLNKDEREVLVLALQLLCNKDLANLIEFAVESGMRRSEILRIHSKDIDVRTHLLHIPKAKNGHSRTIPLTKRASEILGEQQSKHSDTLFPLTANAVNLGWQRFRKKIEMDELRFHDLRHEAISTFFEKGLSIPEVQLISGHRDVRQLFRYTHINPESVLKKYFL